jgi:hypothetical protein
VGANSGLYDYLYLDGSDNTNVATDSRAKAWWLGTNFELSMFDPLTFSLDVVYGHLNRANLAIVDPLNGAPNTWNLGGWGTEGWYIGATLDYKLDFMTPGIFGWWASGDRASDVEDGMMGRLPVVGVDGGWGPTSFGAVNYYNINNADDSATTIWTATGSWGIGIQLADISFIENLSHTLRVAYYRGTNDSDLISDPNAAVLGIGYANLFKYAADPLYLTDKDYVWEVNFDHKYKIYENLTAVLELGYLRLHSDRETWENYRAVTGDKENDNAWKAELLFRYSF